jgi:hypothetical protein
MSSLTEWFDHSALRARIGSKRLTVTSSSTRAISGRRLAASQPSPRKSQADDVETFAISRGITEDYARSPAAFFASDDNGDLCKGCHR